MSAQTFEAWDGALPGSRDGRATGQMHAMGSADPASDPGASTAWTSGPSGPRLTIETASGTRYVIDIETIMMLLTIAQTLMVAYVTITEVLD